MAPLNGTPGTILLVDDEPPVRRVTERVLVRWGYSVLTAGSGREALDLARQHRGRIDLLISDLGMPEMDGHALARAIRQLRPAVAVLFLSGERPGPAADAPVTGESFLQKPFTIEELTAKVRGMLPAA